MSETLDRQMAGHEFGQLCRNLSVFRARNVGPADPDVELKPFVEIDRAEVLDLFFKRRPRFKRFRNNLTRGHQNTFFFIKERWEKEKQV